MTTARADCPSPSERRPRLIANGIRLGSRFLLCVRATGLPLRVVCRPVGRGRQQECELALRLRDCVAVLEFAKRPSPAAAAPASAAVWPTGRRLWKNAEVDHRVPLFRVWSECQNAPWPELLDYWGLPNLQMINRDAHAAKSVTEARDRRAARKPTVRRKRAASRTFRPRPKIIDHIRLAKCKIGIGNGGGHALAPTPRLPSPPLLAWG